MKKFFSVFLSTLVLSVSAQAVTKLNGAGASFPYAIYSKWFSEYSKANKEVRFNYQPIGSGGGIRQLIKQTVDFGASDAPMKAKDIKKAAWPVMHVPTVLGAVALAYNQPGVDKGLKLDGEVLSNIFLGKITKWNDKAIAKLNPGMSLPNKDILIVRRADGSGTTKVFSEYLSAASAEWKNKVGIGKSLRWPVGIGAKGNDGVTAIIKQTEGAIGYIDLAHAVKNSLSTVALKNKAGAFVAPTVSSISNSASEFKTKGTDFTASLIDQPGKNAYPISAFTYILLPIYKKNAKLVEIHKFINWALTTGQGMASDLYYAPLPDSLRKNILKEISKL
jgi:phosphate transport system substrate-binding protein